MADQEPTRVTREDITWAIIYGFPVLISVAFIAATIGIVIGGIL